ncbi:MAG TPA: CAP domain-containing protein [Actinomycetota bacterium]
MGIRKVLSGALVSALTLGILSVAASSASALTSQEQAFVDRINAERRQRGLNTLVVKNDLADVARRHSRRMAAEGSIWHNPNLGNEVDGWQVIGENVGMGPSVESLHAAFMNSKPHRDNILYSSYNQIGVGNAVDESGTIYTTHVFAKRRSTSSTTTKKKTTTTTTKKVASTTTSAPAPKPAPASAAAAPKPKPKPVTAEPRTVDLLMRMVGLDAEDVDPATGAAAGF